jgi:hypothetical protein
MNKNYNIEEIYDLYFNKMLSLGEISKLISLDRGSLRRLFRKNNWTWRGDKEANKIRHKKRWDDFYKILIDNKDDVIKMYGENHICAKDIGEKYGFDEQNIIKFLRKNNIKIKSAHEYQKATYTLQEYDDLLKSRNIIRLTKIDDFSAFHRKSYIDLQCLVCNVVWRPQFNSIPNGHSYGCPVCKHKNQKLTYKSLVSVLTCQIHSEYNLCTYVGLEKPSKKARVDFYFEVDNKRVAVEYNGKQHYEMSKRWFGGEEGFIRRQHRDNEVRKYCQTNGIILIEIDGREYSFYKKPIHDFLVDKLKELKIIS